jgi:hypothetical protein
MTAVSLHARHGADRYALAYVRYDNNSLSKGQQRRAGAWRASST